MSSLEARAKRIFHSFADLSLSIHPESGLVLLCWISALWTGKPSKLKTSEANWLLLGRKTIQGLEGAEGVTMLNPPEVPLRSDSLRFISAYHMYSHGAYQ